MAARYTRCGRSGPLALHELFGLVNPGNLTVSAVHDAVGGGRGLGPGGSGASLPWAVSEVAPSAGAPVISGTAMSFSASAWARGAGRPPLSDGGADPPALSGPLNAPLSVLSAVVTSLGMTQNVFPWACASCGSVCRY